MKITRISVLLILSFSFFLAAHVKTIAQSDTTVLWNIITLDGNEYSGIIALQTEKELTLKTTSIGTITLQLLNIKKMTKVKLENIKRNGIWMENPQEGRYFFSPSSYGLKKGEGYYQNTWIFLNQISYGVTDNFSIGAGLVPLFLFGGAPFPFWVTPKFSIPLENEKLAVGGGALLGTVVGEGGSYGVVYGTTTYGNREKNATIGVGYGYVDGQFASSPTITFSAMIRTGKKGYFITENYFLSAGDEIVGLLSFGGRRIWGSVSLDYGGIIPVGSGINEAIVIPWLSVVIAFGR